MDALTPGIQSTFAGQAGATLTAGLWMQLTGTTSLAVYNFSVEYNRNELTFQSRSETPAALTGLSELDSSNGHNISTGQLYRFDGGTFAATGGPTAPFGPVKVGEVVFSTLNPAGSPGAIDVAPGRFEATFDTFFDNLGAEVTNLVTFNGGTFVVAIPEPTSLSLLGLSASVCSIFRRRRYA